MIEFVYPHTHLVAGVDEVGRGRLWSARSSLLPSFWIRLALLSVLTTQKLSEKRRPGAV